MADEITSPVTAADFVIADKDGKALEVSNAAIKQTDKSTVVLTTSTQEAKEYTLKIKGETAGKFTGVSAVVPTAISVVAPSQQATVGKEVTVSAKVTVPEGQSKAGIPVTFNVTSDTTTGALQNGKLEAVAYTNEEGVASYTYTRYYSHNDSVVAYATSKSSVSANAKVYWADELSLTEVTTGNALANGSKKVYKITGDANRTYNIGYKENVGTTADKLVSVQVVDVNGTGNGTFPYQLSNNAGSRQVTVTTDSNGVATFTLTGANESVTPFVFLDSTDNDKFDATELYAQAPTLKFEDVAYYGVTLKAEGSNYAAVDSGNKGQGGRDFTITLKDKDGKVAKKGEKVYVFLDEKLSSSDVYLLDENDAKVRRSNGTVSASVVEAVVENDKGEATFTVYGESLTSYATPVVFIDRDNDEILDTTDLKVTASEMTYFAAAKTSSVDVTFYDQAGKVVTTQQATKAVTAEIEILDQNGKLNPVNTTARFEVTNPSASNLTVTANGTPETFSQTTKTYTVNVVNGKASITLDAASALTVKVYASAGTFADTQSVEFTANPVTVVRGTVASVDATAGEQSITLTDGTVIELDGLTLRAFGSDANYTAANFLKNVVSVGEILEFNPSSKTVTVQDTDGTGEGALVAADAANLSVNYNGVGSTIALPATTANGYAISWEEKANSDAANVASLTGNTITITRSAADDVDDTVTYVATVTDGTTTSTKEIEFTVKEAKAPVVSGVTDNQSVASGGSVTPTFNEGTATLSVDGAAATPFTSGTTVSAPGTYVLTVTDAAGNQTVINFTIAS